MKLQERCCQGLSASSASQRPTVVAETGWLMASRAGYFGRQPHPANPDQPLAGGPQMVEISRDGRHAYVTNSLYGAWDDTLASPLPLLGGTWLSLLAATGRARLAAALARLTRKREPPGLPKPPTR